MATKAKPKTNAEKQAERRAELDYFTQVEQQRLEQRAARQAESDAFLARVQARRDAEAAALEAGIELPPADIPTLNGVYQAKAAEERAAAEEAERQRIASLDPTSVIFSALPVAKKEFINSWRNANPGMEFPLAALPFL